MTTSFLPENYEVPQSNSSYLKLPVGETKIRILTQPVIGWIDWKDNQPHRFRMNNKPQKSFDPLKPVRHFWALLVFDYTDNDIKIFEITQSTIQKQIENLAKDSEWGNPGQYDLKITKKGQDKSTEYSLTPSPKKTLSEEIKERAKVKPVYLNHLFENKDPFVLPQTGEQTQLIYETLPF